jgi:L-fucose isomerase-like protein
MKTLQPVLQGSVKIMVNKGPADMIDEFIKSNAKSYDPEDVAALAQAFMDFLEACEAALQLNKDITPPEMQAFHSELAQGYEETVQQIAPYCRGFLQQKEKKPTRTGKRRVKLTKKK